MSLMDLSEDYTNEVEELNTAKASILAYEFETA